MTAPITPTDTIMGTLLCVVGLALSALVVWIFASIASGRAETNDPRPDPQQGTTLSRWEAQRRAELEQEAKRLDSARQAWYAQRAVSGELFTLKADGITHGDPPKGLTLDDDGRIIGVERW